MRPPSKLTEALWLILLLALFLLAFALDDSYESRQLAPQTELTK